MSFPTKDLFGSHVSRRDILKGIVQGSVAVQFALQADQLRAADAELVVDGYCDRMSCLPGDEVGLCVSTNGTRYQVEVSRVGTDRRVVWKSSELPGALHPVPADAAMRGCRWPVGVKIPVGKEWRSGLYRIVLRAIDGSRRSQPREAIFIVRSARPGKENQILLQIATNTYQAYNEWAGTTLYSGPDYPRVSFDKPFLIYDLPLKPGAIWYNPNTSNYHAWDEPFIEWAEKAGYGIDYCSNLDLEFHPDQVKPYKLVLSVGHDEYWSAGMRDTLESFIDNGGNAAFFSGNSICWQVRVENKVGEEGRELVCYKRVHERDPSFKAGDLAHLSTLWSDPLVGRPENHLSGVGFAYGGYNGLHGEFMSGPGAGEYTVHRPGHWILEGTGLKEGEKFGAEHGIAGYECDGCEWVLVNGRPVPTGRDGTPKDFEIVATAPCRWNEREGSLAWSHDIRRAFPPGDLMPDDIERDGTGVVGTFTRGGTVATVGSCDWTDGLKAGDPIAGRIVRNILDRLRG